MAEIFISYSRRDKDFVRRLGEALVSRKREPWVDWKDIPLTAEWQQEILRNIEAADNFIFVISPDSVASVNCRKEIDHAVANHKRMVPIYFRAVADDAIPETLGRFQRLDFDDSSQFYAKFETLITALDTDLPWTQAHTRLLTRAKEWERESSDRSFLLHGKDLREAEQWIAKSADREPKPTTLQSQYILASRQSATRTQRIIIGGVAVAFLVAVGLAIYAFLQKNVAQFETKEAQTQRQKADANAKTAQDNADEAIRQKETAVKNEREAKRQEGIAKDETAKAILQAKITNARRLATESLYRFGYTGDDLARSGMLALESLQAYPTTEGMKALSQVLRLIPASPRSIPNAHSGPVGALAFSRDGRWLASASSKDGQVILWDLSSGNKHRVLELQYPYYSPAGAMAFSPDGKWLAAGCARGGSQGALCVWNTATGKPGEPPIRHAYIVRSLAFSPDGQYLATSTYGEGAGHGARLFRMASNSWQQVDSFPSGTGPDVAVIFNRDGTLAVADKSGVWLTQPDATSAGNPNRFSELGPCYALGLTNDAANIAALCQQGIAVAKLEDEKYQFEGSELAFSDIRSLEELRMSASPDGNFVAVGDIVYSIRGSGPSLVLAAHVPRLQAVAYHPSAKLVAGGLPDGSIALWPVTQGNASFPLPAATPPATGLAVSHDERSLATIDDDGQLRIYDISTLQRIRPAQQTKLAPKPQRVFFSPDGRSLIVIASDRLHLLHVDTLAPIAERQVSGEVEAAFTRDGHTLILLDSSGIRRIDPGTGKEKGPAIPGKFTDFSLGPDDDLLSTWSQLMIPGKHGYFESRRVWKLSTRSELAWDEKVVGAAGDPPTRPPQGGMQKLLREAAGWPSATKSRNVSADNNWIFDLNRWSPTLVLREAATNREIAMLEHDGDVIDAAFSPQSRWLITSSEGGAIRLWPLKQDDLAAQACRLLPRNLTSDEWKEFQMDGPYRKTCPNLP
ncbi:MAG TPA: TIR domain-containing protein [Candidatus Bathyarchaeia archaeon]|nr:TIR domain-containing protein [Candidatus Bathyarchaeia archaeon]